MSKYSYVEEGQAAQYWRDAPRLPPNLEPLSVFAARNPSLAEVAARYKAYNDPLAEQYNLRQEKSLSREVCELVRSAKGSSPRVAQWLMWEAILKLAERLEAR